MKHITEFVFILMLLIPLSCFDDGGSDSSGGTLKITVNTAPEIWGWPKLKDGSTTDYEAYSGDILYTWQYPATGGEEVTADPETNLANQPIPYPDTALGNRKNYVYVYGTLGDASGSTPVLYRGESSSNNSVITIKGIMPGDYYIVVFYDYKTGGVVTNMLNRYDRYAIYTETPFGGTANSTPYVDKASFIAVSQDQTTEVTMEIKRDWLLGRPKTEGGGTGRIFLKEANGTPSP